MISTLTFVMQTFPEFGNTDRYPILIQILEIIDNVSVYFFTAEYVIRFACAPVKWRFFKHPMNMVDLAAVVPYYITIILDHLEDIKIIGKAGKLIRLVRVLRIMRIFKLVRHFAGLQSLVYTLNQAYKELGLLLHIISGCHFTYSCVS